VPRLRARSGWVSLFLSVSCLLSLAACAATSTDLRPTPISAATATSVVSPTATSGAGVEVKIFFSRHPETDSNVNAVFSVKRVSPDVKVATYATRQLIVGPTAAEKAQGYFTELTTSLTGVSNCSGADFQITLDTHIDAHTGIPSAQLGTAVLTFCRAVQLAGDLAGARIAAELNATLTQFATIKKAQILTSAGQCFNDLSGQDNC
jgi:hypothetical protein